MKNSLAKISIGLVIYNGVEHLQVALESIVKQSYKNIELIVVDGGSTDGTEKVLHEHANHISVLVSEPDKGVYDAMNKVCSLATGDWLIFLGCDDVLLDNICGIAASLRQPGVVYYGDVILRSTGKVSGGKFSRYRLMNRNIGHQGIFYPGSVYKNYSYNLDYKWLADYDYNIRLFGDDVPFIYLKKVISIFNDKGGSSLGDAAFEKHKMKLIREKFGVLFWIVKLIRNRIEKVAKRIRGGNHPSGWN